MFTKIVVGVDGRPGGRDAIALGAALERTGARLVLAHVIAYGLLPDRVPTRVPVFNLGELRAGRLRMASVSPLGLASAFCGRPVGAWSGGR